MALSQSEYRRQTRKATDRKKQGIRILAVLGSSQGIDVEREACLLQQLPDATVEFLVSPSRQSFNAQLWRPEGWDILFFAGHSQTQESQTQESQISEGQIQQDSMREGSGRIYINEAPTNNSLTLSQLEEALRAAIAGGLQLAIFNSCDGLGLAKDLEKLYIPTVVVMREPVPNRVAQIFFDRFIWAFARDLLPLYLAFQQARRQLQGIEDEFPSASWLPVICQNLAVDPPTWQSLGGRVPCPYQGLSAFQEQDAPLFFGREKFAENLLVAANTKSLVAVVGPSGSGKSSVVFAGLVPKLRQTADGFHKIVSFRPGNSPFEAMAEALLPLKDRYAANQHSAERIDLLKDLAIVFRVDNQALSRTISTIAQNTKLTLIVDQFEELYTLSSAANRQPFLDGLTAAIDAAPTFTLILTLRADFYGHALSYRPFGTRLQGAVQNLCPMAL